MPARGRWHLPQQAAHKADPNPNPNPNSDRSRQAGIHGALLLAVLVSLMPQHRSRVSTSTRPIAPKSSLLDPVTMMRKLSLRDSVSTSQRREVKQSKASPLLSQPCRRPYEMVPGSLRSSRADGAAQRCLINGRHVAA